MRKENANKIIRVKGFSGESEEEFIPISTAISICEQTIKEFNKNAQEIKKSMLEKIAKTAKKTEKFSGKEKYICVLDLIEIILLQKVVFHFQFLEKVRDTFRLFEKNDSGFLEIESLDEFVEELGEDVLDVGNEEFEKFKNAGFKFVGLSDVVRVLSEIVVEENGEYRTVLDKMYKGK